MVDDFEFLTIIKDCNA